MRFIVVTNQFKKDFKKVPMNIQIKAHEKTEKLCINILDKSLNICKLKLKDNLWRIRINQYRLVYSFDKDSIILHRILHRKDIYNQLF